MQKDKENIKNYFKQVIIPFFNQIQKTTENILAIQNAENTIGIQLHYVKNNITEVFGFVNLESLETTIDLYSKNEADCITICTCTIAYNIPNSAINFPEITIYCKFFPQYVSLVDTFGHLMQVPYEINSASSDVAYFAQQIIEKYKAELNVSNN